MGECNNESEICENGIHSEWKIRCIFFCEFHPTAGPIISCQVPENFISKELFDSISVYIITKAELQRSTITVTLSEYKILGFPVRIDDKKYKRNAFHFNLCIVCDSNSRTVHYESVVTKFSEYLTAMEMESSFLSEGPVAVKLSPILKEVLENLNKYGECALSEGPTATHLKMVRIRSDPTPVSDHQVPVLIRPLPTHPWDLTTQQVAPHLDGFNHVARIAALADVETNLAKACVQNLAYYGLVALVPLFQYGNVYCTTPRLSQLAHDTELQGKCLRYVARCVRQTPHLRDVFRMYAAMARGTSVRDLCQRLSPATLKINERKLVQFGVLHGIVRRVHKYPVLLSPNSSGDLDSEELIGASCNSELQRSLSGSASIDEICCATGVGAQQLEDQLERDHNVVILWK